MYPYTICFIQQNDSILLLNREKSPWMGCWNGVGGKIHTDETPYAGAVREIEEETGLYLPDIVNRGCVTWDIDGERLSGMHLFHVRMKPDALYQTPIATREGILDWKSMEWIMHPENQGVATNIPYFIQWLVQEESRGHYHCVYRAGELLRIETKSPVDHPDRVIHASAERK